MVALHVVFTLLVVVIAIAVIGLSFSGAFENAKKFFAKNEDIIRGGGIICKTTTLFATAEMPSVSKRTELLPVFVFRGNVVPTQQKVSFDPTKEIKTETLESAPLVGTPPEKGESFIFALFSDDQKCREAIKSSLILEKIIPECGRFAVDVKSFPLTGDCLAQSTVGPVKNLQGQVSLQTLPAGSGLCSVKAYLKNTGSDWFAEDQVKVILYCDPYRPSTRSTPATGGLVLKSGEESAVNVVWPCNNPTKGDKYMVELKASSALLDSEMFECV